jgi:dTDP-4-amino-4,6-dideoxygalactose transaminase
MIDAKRLEKEANDGKTPEEKQEKFEKALAKTAGTKYAVLFGSGNHALSTGLKNLGLGQSDETLVQAFTCKQVPKIISQVCKTVLTDIDENYNISLKSAGKQITKKTRMMQAIYSYGKAIESAELEEFCEKNDLILVEDCAHSLGAKNGKKTGSFGEFSVFSLRKNLPVGNGGALCTNNRSLYEKCVVERNSNRRNASLRKNALESNIIFFRKNFPQAEFPYFFLSKLGYGKSEMNKEFLDSFEISLAIQSLEMLPEIVRGTVSNAKLLIRELGEEKFVLPRDEKNEINVYTRVPVFFNHPAKSTEKIWQELQNDGFETGLFYKKDFELTAGTEKAKLPVSVRASEHMVPVGVQGLTKEQIINLAEKIREFSE